MNTDFLGGVNETDIRTLGVEILKSSERISDIFDSIDAKMNELPDYYKSSSSDEFCRSYELIKANIISYSDDLFRLVDKMKEGLDEVSSMIENFTEDRKSKAKVIEYKEVL